MWYLYFDAQSVSQCTVCRSRLLEAAEELSFWWSLWNSVLNFDKMVYKSIILIVISALCVSESLRPRGVPPDMAHFYDPNSSFHCLDGSGEIPFEHVNDDYCDCKARKLCLLFYVYILIIWFKEFWSFFPWDNKLF